MTPQVQQGSSDAWNWNWGDEDNSNAIQSSQAQSTNQFGANSISGSFASNESWNWTVDDQNLSASSSKPDLGSASYSNLDNKPMVFSNADDLLPKIGKSAQKHLNNADSEFQAKLFTHHVANIKPEKLNQIKQQWSTESQLSQESSDDILQTSESDKILSHSSTISHSPISTHEGIVDNSAQVHQQNLQDVSIGEETFNAEEMTASIPWENAPLQGENVEILPVQQHGLQGSVLNTTTSPINPTSLQPVKTRTPPSSFATQVPPLMPPPVSQLGTSDDTKNPYKRGAVSLQKNNVFRPPQNFYQPGNFPPFSQSVNLETMPDNSEQPDPLPVYSSASNSTQVTTTRTPVSSAPENNEMAPINERNQYLETGQLSDENNLTQPESTDPLPPPGLHRMVLGQIESNLQASSVEQTDEPPPGLSRMVLGQTESSSLIQINMGQLDQGGPPVGLHRMIPGESSSPESLSRHQYQTISSPNTYEESSRQEDYNSEIELNQMAPLSRSATIGADTPPSVISNSNIQMNMNRSEAVGADVDEENGSDEYMNIISSENRLEAVGGGDNDERDNNLSRNVRDELSKYFYYIIQKL